MNAVTGLCCLAAIALFVLCPAARAEDFFKVAWKVQMAPSAIGSGGSELGIKFQFYNGRIHTWFHKPRDAAIGFVSSTSLNHFDLGPQLGLLSHDQPAALF